MVRRFKLVNTSGSWYIRDSEGKLLPYYLLPSNTASKVAEMIDDLNYQSMGAKASRIAMLDNQIAHTASRYGIVGAQSRVNH